MTEQLLRLFFPPQMRMMPFRRFWQSLFRSVHIIFFSLLFAGMYLGHNDQDLALWFLGVILSGLGMLAIELYGSFMVLFEIKGLAILFKLLCLLTLPLWSADSRFWLLCVLIIFSTFISHSSRKIRHRNLMPRDLQDRIAMVTDPEFKL